MIKTERLLLRRWRKADIGPFATLNADSRVMRFLPAPLSREESDALVERIERHFEENGFGLWALETLESGSFIGFVGLSKPRFQAFFTPCVEIGWRIAFDSWNRGYATEGALAALDFGFRVARLPEIVSFTSSANVASRRVMEKIGMSRDPGEDFDHPSIPLGSPLRRHVLYRKSSDVGPGRRFP